MGNIIWVGADALCIFFRIARNWYIELVIFKAPEQYIPFCFFLVLFVRCSSSSVNDAVSNRLRMRRNKRYSAGSSGSLGTQNVRYAGIHHLTLKRIVVLKKH